MAACRCEQGDYRAIRLEPKDLVVYAVILGKLGEAIRRTLGFDCANGTGQSFGPHTMRLGTFGPGRIPVLFHTPFDRDTLLNELESVLAVVVGPFILATPTGSFYTATMEQMQQRHRFLLLPLSGTPAIPSAKACTSAAPAWSSARCSLWANSTPPSPTPTRAWPTRPVRDNPVNRLGEESPPISRGKDRLYRCLDRLLPHQPALEQHLAARWKDLFGATFDLLLYDLTSTYFEGDADAVLQARRGYSRDHRPDCKQLVLALVVTPEGFPA